MSLFVCALFHKLFTTNIFQHSLNHLWICFLAGEIQSPGSAGSSATSPTSPSGPAPASLTRSPVERYLKAPAPGGKSLLPKPEISPKPSHLRGVTSNGVVNHLMTGSLQMQNGNGNARYGLFSNVNCFLPLPYRWRLLFTFTQTTAFAIFCNQSQFPPFAHN